MLKNLTIRQKLLLAVGIPLGFILILSVYLLYNQYEKLKLQHNYKKILNLTILYMSNTLVELQKERGLILLI
ncbi:MAG: hypothetical protein ABGX26_05950 [Nautiliaceae bacterium]